MTETTLHIPDYVTMITPADKRTTAELAAFAVGLLVEDLPQPAYLGVSQAGQEISLQFADTADSFRALAQWAERFGGTVTACPHNDRDGRESAHVQVRFAHLGVHVEAYAFITAGQTASSTP